MILHVEIKYYKIFHFKKMRKFIIEHQHEINFYRKYNSKPYYISYNIKLVLIIKSNTNGIYKKKI
jgi:hypothetical protein